MNADDRSLFRELLSTLSGSNQHLIKSGAPDDDADLEAFVDSLSQEEAADLLEAFGDGPSVEERLVQAQPSIEERLDGLETKLAKAEARKWAAHLAKANGEQPANALDLLAKSSRPEVAAVARSLQHEEIRERTERVLSEMRDRPEHATSYMYAKPEGSIQEQAQRTADAVMRLNADDPQASRPRWAW